MTFDILLPRVEELRSSPVSSLMTFDILLPRVEELRSSPVSSLTTFDILMTLSTPSGAGALGILPHYLFVSFNNDSVQQIAPPCPVRGPEAGSPRYIFNPGNESGYIRFSWTWAEDFTPENLPPLSVALPVSPDNVNLAPFFKRRSFRTI